MNLPTKVIACMLFLYQMDAIRPEEKTAKFWHDVSQKELENALRAQQLNTNVAKNVILFVGDGMGVSTITAARIMKGQLQNQSGEEALLEFDKFRHVGLSKTYSVDQQVSSSDATATAILGGVKTKHNTIGLTAAVQSENCASSLAADRVVNSTLVDAYNSGKSTGIVTTTRITHATPAAAYAHTPGRRWQSDGDLPLNALRLGCKDIAQQYFDQSHLFTVTLGGGRMHFQPRTTTDPEYTGKFNKRKDGQDLIGQWKKKHAARNIKAEYVWNKQQFDSIDPLTTDRLWGMFEPGDMKYEAHRELETGIKEPSLADMTEKSIKMLRKNSKGFVLFVEAGRIDHAHHDSNAHLALQDTLALDEAVKRAVEMTSDSDTLIVVTSDHSHVMTLGGNSARGNPILGVAPSNTNPKIALDGQLYTTITYGNGPGFRGGTIKNWCHNRINLAGVDTKTSTYVQQSAVPLNTETHGGEDVAIYARGPMAHLFHGTHEQNYIARVVRYASCIGADQSHCDGKSTDTNGTKNVGIENNGTDINGTDSIGIEDIGNDSNSTKNDTNQNGVKTIDTSNSSTEHLSNDNRCPDNIGIEKNGTDNNGTKNVGTKNSGTDHIGLTNNGTKNTDTKSNGFKNIGTENNGTASNGTNNNGIGNHIGNNGTDHIGNDNNRTHNTAIKKNSTDTISSENNGTINVGTEIKNTNHIGLTNNGTGNNGTDHIGNDNNRTDNTAIKKNSTDTISSENNGTINAGTEIKNTNHIGLANNGTGNNGTDHIGNDNNHTDNTATEKNSTENNGTINVGTENNGTNHIGLANNGTKSNSTGNNGTNQIGNDNNFTDNTDIEKNSTGTISTENNGTKNIGTKRDGTDNIGTDSNGTENNDTENSRTSFLGLNLGTREVQIVLYVEFGLLLLFALILIIVACVLCCRKS